MRCKVNMMVAEDMLPKSRNTPRDQSSACAPSRSPCCTPSSTVRPPPCTAHRSTSLTACPRSRPPSSLRSNSPRSAAEIRAGTLPDNRMSNPWSPIRQVIRSAESGRVVARKSSSAMPCGSAVTSAALAPSPNSRNDSTVSKSGVSCRCSVHSSRLITSTRAAGSDRTALYATRNAGTAP